MTRCHKAIRALAAAALFATALVGNSQAALISVVPATQTIAPGGTANIDIVLSGLGANQVVGGFSFLLSYNNSILGAPASFTPNPGNVMGAAPLDLSGGFTGAGGSPLDVFYVADALITSANLKALEGTGFTLATVHLTGLNQGLSALTLSVPQPGGAFLSDVDGFPTIAATVVNGSVCVAAPGAAGNVCVTATVPEPGTLALILLGLGFAFMGLRRQQLGV